MAGGWVEVADGVRVGRTAPGPWVNVVLLDDGDVLVDAGLRPARGRLARLLGDRGVATHVVTHAHADHVGATAWLRRERGAVLAVGEGDAARFEAGRIDTVASPLGRAVARALEVERAPVDRRLREGDRVGGFAVLEVPGHSPGTIALWRERDRVLVVGDGPVNLSRDPRAPRFVPLPRGLHHDAAAARASRRRLAALRPEVVVPAHGHVVRAPDAWARAVGA